TTADQIQRAEQEQREQLRKQHMPESWAATGTVFEDQYIRIIRDPVRFPSGRLGTYIRIERPAGVKNGVLAVTRVGESYLFVRHWRHATGRFHLEFPRGFTDQNEEPGHAVIRELREEISADVSSASLLGTIYTDTGLLNFPINVYSVQIVNYALGDGDEGIE